VPSKVIQPEPQDAANDNHQHQLLDEFRLRQDVWHAPFLAFVAAFCLLFPRRIVMHFYSSLSSILSVLGTGDPAVRNGYLRSLGPQRIRSGRAVG
jgi:hypothetical protein